MKSRSDRLAEAVCVCLGFTLLAMVWAWLAGAWLDVRSLPAVPWVLGVAAVFGVVHLRTPAQRERVRMSPITVPPWALLVAVPSLMVLKVSVETLLPPGGPSRGGDPVHNWLAAGGGWAPIVLSLALLVPLLEETVFRGMMMGWLERRYGGSVAVVASAAVFAVAHLNLAAMPSLLMAGLVLGCAFRASNSLWAPVLLHVAANATVALSIAGVPFGTRAAELLLLPSAAALVWLGLRFRPAGKSTHAEAATATTDLALVG